MNNKIMINIKTTIGCESPSNNFSPDLPSEQTVVFRPILERKVEAAFLAESSLLPKM
jgi:hypothetical protein